MTKKEQRFRVLGFLAVAVVSALLALAFSSNPLTFLLFLAISIIFFLLMFRQLEYKRRKDEGTMLFFKIAALIAFVGVMIYLLT